jgi:asparagine synthase (glutamine-hydrolysing)
MTDAIVHRGPDDSGAWVDEAHGVALGHRRLSIVDLSPAGHQPMTSSSARYVIVFNGEIYNYRELRADLEQGRQAPVWRGHSDTEVLLAAIEAWGLQGAVTRAVGMFAFALWDRSLRRLSLVRDRLGEKPLYYGLAGRHFIFASELKALRVFPGFDARIDRDALCQFMRFNYVPAPRSIFAGIRKLSPGTIVEFSIDGDRVRELVSARYWSARQCAEEGIRAPFQGTEHEACDELERLLAQSIGGQMVADVPLGAFLSGGIDSSTVVALMQAQSSRPIRTFTIGFGEAEYNEAKHAGAVAKHLGCDHTELYVTPEQAMSVIPRLAVLYDEPFADSSQVPTFLVSELARRHVTVSLSGDGGDELFGGYNRYFWAMKVWRKLRTVPAPLRTVLAKTLQLPSPAAWSRAFAMGAPFVPARHRHANAGDKVHKLAELIGATEPERIYLRLLSHWDAPSELVRGSKEPVNSVTDRREWIDCSDFEHRMMYLDTVAYLPDDILVKVDRAAMGVSLETRVPMLDHRVVEFAWRLPISMKIRDGEGKWPLRRVLDRHVPRKLVDRPKMGFGVPIDHWLRGPLRKWAEDLLDERRLATQGYFEPAPIREKWGEHLSGRRNWQYLLWDVLMFQSWIDHWR